MTKIHFSGGFTRGRPLVVCTQCRGRGRHALTDRNWDTYRRMPVDEWLSTYSVLGMHRRLNRTQLLGRLNTLVENGLVERRKNTGGRGLEWRRVQ